MPTLANAGGSDDGVDGSTATHDRNGVVGRNLDGTPRNAASAGGNGVFGFTQVPDGAGVFGAHASTGMGIAGLGLIGAWGGSVLGVGVVGISAPLGQKGGDGVQGITNSESRNGVYGLNLSTDKRGTGEPAGNGVLGFTRVPDGAGILGVHGGMGTGVAAIGSVGVSGASRDPNVGHGVIGTGGFGVVGSGTIIGVWGQGKGTGWAGYFSGPSRVDGSGEIDGDFSVAGKLSTSGSLQGPLTIDGDISVTGDVVLLPRAVAERFSAAQASLCRPGMVMVIGSDGTVEPCTRAYDKRAVGVVSGAGSLRPAITLGAELAAADSATIAMVGTVNCLVDAGYGAVEAGDLLTSSETPGHARIAADPARCFGAVIGKALAPLAEGSGLVPMIVALQ
jgi:hypothetical protein